MIFFASYIPDLELKNRRTNNNKKPINLEIPTSVDKKPEERLLAPSSRRPDKENHVNTENFSTITALLHRIPQ